MKNFLLLTASVLCYSVEVNNDIIGIYKSGSEISGFSSTVLWIKKDYRGELEYEMISHSDVSSSDWIEQKSVRGDAMVIDNSVIMARPWETKRNGEINLRGFLSVYRKVTVNNINMLMGQNTFELWNTKSKIHDYGILVKVKDGPDKDEYGLDLIKLPDVKLKEIFGIEQWQDPFVHGPNVGK